MSGPLLQPGGDSYALVQPWLDVPAGFRTNGASIPRLLWPFLGSPWEPRLLPAALAHDWAYQVGMPRSAADGDFYRTIRDAGVGRWRAQLLLLGVRLFGWVYWRHCKYGRGVGG